jgi:Tfp pilus assembly protein PilN
MTTINLYQQADGDRKKKTSILASGGLIYAVSVLVFVLVLFAGMKFYNSWLTTRNVGIEDAITQKNSSFLTQDAANQVVDIQARLEVINKNLDSQVIMTDVLRNLSAGMVSGVVATSYKYENQKVTVAFLANNFSDVSRQILNLKKRDSKFSNVSLASINREEAGVNFSISMSADKPEKAVKSATPAPETAAPQPAPLP